MNESKKYPMIPALLDTCNDIRASYWQSPGNKYYSEMRDVLDHLDRYYEDITPILSTLFSPLFDAIENQRRHYEQEFKFSNPDTPYKAYMYKCAIDAEIALLYILAVDTEMFVRESH